MADETSPVVALATELIARRSVTPDDAGCQALIAQRLATRGFVALDLSRDAVTNSWLRRGVGQPLVVFAGHTDVVPAGDERAWSSPPFEPQQTGDWLIGRGASDMKGNLAAFVVACERFLDRYPDHRGSLGLLLTSDEEGPAVAGTVHAVAALAAQQLVEWSSAYCLVGEPTSEGRTADTIKVGRRGSLNARLLVMGKQGHVAYPQLADNPIHRALPALTELVSMPWGDGNEVFPPTGLQISSVRAGSGATNVIPATLAVDFNLRFTPSLTPTQIAQRIAAVLDRHALRYELTWELSAQPFHGGVGTLLAVTQQAIAACRGKPACLSTAGGTSDGRFFAAAGAEVLELGCSNATIHAVDERVSVTELELLSEIYEQLLVGLLVNGG